MLPCSHGRPEGVSSNELAIYCHSLLHFKEPKKSRIEGLYPRSNRINGFDMLVKDEGPAVCQRVICWRPSLTSGQTSDTLMLLVCAELQLSNHSLSSSPLCAYFLMFALPFSQSFLFVPLCFPILCLCVLVMLLCDVRKHTQKKKMQTKHYSFDSFPQSAANPDEIIGVILILTKMPTHSCRHLVTRWNKVTHDGGAYCGCCVAL